MEAVWRQPHFSKLMRQRVVMHPLQPALVMKLRAMRLQLHSKQQMQQTGQVGISAQCGHA